METLQVEPFRDGLIVIRQLDGHHVYLSAADAPAFIENLIEASGYRPAPPGGDPEAAAVTPPSSSPLEYNEQFMVCAALIEAAERYGGEENAGVIAAVDQIVAKLGMAEAFDIAVAAMTAERAAGGGGEEPTR